MAAGMQARAGLVAMLGHAVHVGVSFSGEHYLTYMSGSMGGAVALFIIRSL